MDEDNALITLKIEVQFREKTADEQRIWELNRKASELKETDWNTAIACLAEAQVMRPTVPSQYTVSEYLRLPVFLQQAGRMAEAEIEFEKILSLFEGGYDRYIIYDKMRMVYQREKRFDDAVAFDVMSSACYLIGIKHRADHEQNHLKELLEELEIAESWQKKRLKEYIKNSKENIKREKSDIKRFTSSFKSGVPDNIKKLLKKAKKEHLSAEIIEFFRLFTEDMTMENCHALGKKVAELVIK